MKAGRKKEKTKRQKENKTFSESRWLEPRTPYCWRVLNNQKETEGLQRDCRSVSTSPRSKANEGFCLFTKKKETFSRLALTKSSVLSDAITVTFAEPMFQVSVMIGFVTASLDCLRLDFKQGAIPLH